MRCEVIGKLTKNSFLDDSGRAQRAGAKDGEEFHHMIEIDERIRGRVEVGLTEEVGGGGEKGSHSGEVGMDESVNG